MSERVDAYMLQENPMQWLKVADKKIKEQANEINALRERLKSHQRAVLWCWEWINRALARGLSPEEFANSIGDDRWNEVGALVGEATDEVDP